MNKVYIFLSAACLAATASAAEKEMAAAPQQEAVTLQKFTKSAAPLVGKSRIAAERAALPLGQKMKAAQVPATRAVNGAGLYFRAADNIMAIGPDTDGSGFKGLGFGSPYGTLDFWNFSVGATDMIWTYSEMEDYEIVNNAIDWNLKESSDLDLSVKSGIGLVYGPDLEGKVDGSVADDQGPFNALYCGGSPSYYFRSGEGAECGLSFYQNQYLQDPEGYTGSPLEGYAYNPGGQGFEASGAASSWYTTLRRQYPDNTFTDLELQNITVIQPAPASPYLMSTSWIWMQVDAKASTQLTSYIYPFDEEGYIAEMPIAVGYASIPKGKTNTPVFYYNALNEEGDEIEGDILITGEVAFTFEGFNGNDAITSVMTVGGMYPFSYSMYEQSPYEDFIKAPDMYANLSFKVDGQATGAILASTGLYYFDQRKNPDGTFVDDDTVSMYAYAQLTVDAVYPWIMSANGEKSVTLPLAGGEADVDVNALYYNIPSLIESEDYVVTHSDWVNVAFGVANQQTGNTTMTVAAEASDVDRKGFVEIQGLGLTYHLDVIQGEDNAVNVVVSDKNAQYFDLQGRRVANPDKGIYIKKTANKSEKVIL